MEPRRSIAMLLGFGCLLAAVYCRSGVRSESAYTTLTSSGFATVWVMEGGIERLIAAGYPIVHD